MEELEAEFLKPEPVINGVRMRPVDYGSKDLLRQATRFLPPPIPETIPENETAEEKSAREERLKADRVTRGLLYLHFFLFIQGGDLDLVISSLDEERTWIHAVRRFMVGWSESEALKGAKWHAKMFRLEQGTQFNIVERKKSDDKGEKPPPNG